MIYVAGSADFQLDESQLTYLERRILDEKRRSNEIYVYSSPASLIHELKVRSQIVAAANELSRSGVNFADFNRSKSNPVYWNRTANGGFQLVSGQSPSDAIRDIFNNGPLYAFECATAIIIIMYKAVLETIGKEAFDRYFTDLYLRDWNVDSDLRFVTHHNNQAVYPGDVLYFENPDHDPLQPWWQGENVVMLDRDLYYGHGIGVGSGEEIIQELNQYRKRGARTSAFLSDIVLMPDYEYIRRLMENRHPLDILQSCSGNRIAARIGSHLFVADY
ncbi:protein-glutamine gamma-glutamyltransferase [Paenibacillus sp. 1001270B_150601_E10]|uniref:protein-glutamine gamma-glutamyltransferase n=1 Tax=Paenibacillus sp. 1001270B_150601_E10 TaxID=2787079 RepID=UPI00189E83F4|nr:protein-glutamine gamma-glutamyltransferase [Paenibacillus sp. 1001270B_150601_E10]